jgi:predicted CopG family antitoxin
MKNTAETGEPMRTLTISVADDVYQRASEKAAAAETSVPKVVQDFLSRWTRDELHAVPENQRCADFLQFLDELQTRPLKPGPSVGPLNREELYQRGVSGY